MKRIVPWSSHHVRTPGKSASPDPTAPQSPASRTVSTQLVCGIRPGLWYLVEAAGMD